MVFPTEGFLEVAIESWPDMYICTYKYLYIFTYKFCMHLYLCIINFK